MEVDLTDSDTDGLPDFYEDIIETDKFRIDSDEDGLPDGYEIFTNHTYPNKKDTNDNGIVDGLEDSDSDGLTNIEEYELVLNPLDSDTDGDGLRDSVELKYNMNPNKQDTLDDGIMDGDRIFDIKVECETSDNNILKPSISLDMKGTQIDSFVARKLDNDDPFLNDRVPGYIGNGYEFCIDDGITEALLEIEISRDVLINSNINPVLYYWNEDSQLFEEVSNQYKNENGISATLNHFSQYIVLDKNKYEELAFRFAIKSPNADETIKKKCDIVIALDESGSIETRDFDYMKVQCASLVETLDSNDRVSVFAFSNTIRKISSFISPTYASDCLRNLKMAYGYTAIYETIRYAIEEFEKYSSDDAAKSIIILTDGSDTSSSITVPELIVMANENNISIYTVGIGSVDSDILAELSHSTGGEYYHISNFYQLGNVFDQMITESDLYRDTDGDGISDYHEKKIASGQLFSGSGEALNLCSSMNFRSNDSDGDGLLDGEEVSIKKLPYTDNYYCYMTSNPCMVDTDLDSYDDYVEEYIGVSPVNKVNRLDETKYSTFNLPGFKYNGWDDWKELLENHPWNYIHNAVQADVTLHYPDIVSEVPIKGVGRCDLLRPTTSEIWEVKPSSYINPAKLAMAEAQLELYVLALPGIRGGDILDNTFPYGDYVVNYYDLGDGIILYSYGKSKPQEDSVTVTEKERGYTYVPKTAPSDELLFWGDIAAVSIISGTLLEDFFTGGIGIADDAACFWLAYELMKN